MVNELFKRTINFPEPVFLEETVSTNLYLQALCDRIRQEDLTCVYTSFQSAGRGQRGNSWESEKGKKPPVQLRRLSQPPGSGTPVPAFTDNRAGSKGNAVAVCRQYPHQVAQRHLLERQEALRDTDRKRPDRHTHKPFHIGNGGESESGKIRKQRPQSGIAETNHRTHVLPEGYAPPDS